MTAGASPAAVRIHDLVEEAVAKMMAESGLAEHLVRNMIAMEAARSPKSLPFLAGVSAPCNFKFSEPDADGWMTLIPIEPVLAA